MTTAFQSACPLLCSYLESKTGRNFEQRI